jgi:type I restriction enzyme, S subunit
LASDRSDWTETTLAELCASGGGEIQTGPFGSQLHASDYNADGIPVVMPQDLRGDVISTEKIARVGSEHQERLQRHQLRVGDIVYARRGDLTRRALVREREESWLCGTGCLRIRPGSGVSPEYLFNALGHPTTQEWIARHAVGATMPNLNTSILGACPLVVPPAAEQHRIVGVLRALESRVAAGFEVERLSLEVLHQVVAHHAARLPTTASLTDLASFINGRAFTKDADGSGRPILRIRELNNGVDHSTLRADIDAKSEHVATPGDLLFSWSGSLEAYRWSACDALINQHIFKVVPSRSTPQWYVEFWLRRHLRFFKAIAAEKATTMGHIKREHLVEAKVAPWTEELATTLGNIGVLDDQAWLVTAERQRLQSLRSTLLPKLISGQIRVPATADGSEAVETVLADVHAHSDPERSEPRTWQNPLPLDRDKVL